jgi:RNA polymerase sigma factor (TIGR02999 family)
MSDVTRILYAIEDGDAKAAGELLPLVYDQLRKTAQERMRAERAGHSLDATALVHEAWLKLVGGDTAGSGRATGLQWANRAHFYAAAAEAMRRILLNRARDKKRLKRGGDRHRIDLDQIEFALNTDHDELIALDESLEKLSAEDALGAQLVKLRFFAGLSMREAAESLGLTQRTAERQWAYARAWLYHELSGDGPAVGR